MAAFKPNPLGILKNVDLLWLYYGAPLKAVVKVTHFNVPTGPNLVQILGPDPRRIKYEIVMGFFAAGTSQVFVGSQTEMDQAAAAGYLQLNQGTIIISRSFLTDLDTVCDAQFARKIGGGCDLSVRETILTPVGVDVIPENA